MPAATMADITRCCDARHMKNGPRTDGVADPRSSRYANLGSGMAEETQIYVGTAGWSYKDWKASSIRRR